MPELLPIVFTVFEPSGDVLAAKLIEEIKRRQPARPIVAFGGPLMEAAGATLLEETTQHAKMGLGAVSEAKELLRRKGVLSRWLKENDVAALVPTDSPAANWSMCAAARKQRPNAKIVHLVGPQMWAWAPWRIKKMRRLSDHLLALLPFEVEWFGSRGVPTTFVGHPMFDETPQADTADTARSIDGAPLSHGEPRLALLPGSRGKEIELNWPTMLRVYDQVRHRHKGMAVTIAAVNEERAAQINRLCPGGRPPRGMQVVVGDTTGVLDWADVALVCSGTATLQAASRGVPMVVLYNANMRAWKLAGRWLIRSRTFALPNVIAESLGLEKAVPELVPHDGSAEPVAKLLLPLLKDGPERQDQREMFEGVRKAFTGKRFQSESADALLGVLSGD